MGALPALLAKNQIVFVDVTRRHVEFFLLAPFAYEGRSLKPVDKHP
jgi:hypothetical protein